MKVRGYVLGLDMPERAMLARVNRVELLGEGDQARTSYELDSIDQLEINTPMAELAAGGRRQPFAVVRVMTTASRFCDLIGVEPQEGDWLAFESGPRAVGKTRQDRIQAWHAQLTEAGYTDISRGYVFGARLVYRDGEGAPASVGAKAPLSALAARVRVMKAFPRSVVASAAKIRKALTGFTIEQVRIRDVGQASFVTLLDGRGRPRVHFDAGWPLGFNYRGTPKELPVEFGRKAPIILSHWDWDHLQAYDRVPELKDHPWIVPSQDLSPGAARIMEELKAKGLLIGVGASVSVGWGELGVCTGAPSETNHSGLALRVHLDGGHNVLLVGDAHYHMTPAPLRAAPLHGLVVTHHGAHFDGPVPPAASRLSRAIISCGHGNVYRHPRLGAMTKHTVQGWRLQRTSTFRSDKRGDRWLV